MNLIFLGPPGAGKGTQAERICEEFSLAHISTGEILRKELRAGTELGKRAKEYVDKGALVPDDVIIGIVAQRVEQSDCENGFLLDGFPRTLAQAEALAKIVRIDRVVNLEVPLEMLAERISGRRMCPKCGATYHVSALPSPDALCRCGEKLYQREDDKIETVLSRLNVYTEQTKPLVGYYSENGLIAEVDGNRPIGDVYSDIATLLESLR